MTFFKVTMYIKYYQYKNILSSLSDTDINNLRHLIDEVLTTHYADLRDLSTTCLEAFATEMFAAHLINKEVQKSPSFDGIIGEFKAALNFMRRRSQIETHCAKFLLVFTKLGGSFIIAGSVLQEDWIEIGRTKYGLELQLNIK